MLNALDKAWIYLAAIGAKGTLRGRIEELSPHKLHTLSIEEVRKRLERPKLKAIAKEEMKGYFDTLERFVAQKNHILRGDALEALLEAKSRPLMVFARGNPGLLRRKRFVSIVGTRNASERGRIRAHKLAGYFASQGAVLVSGGAMGIDMAAHRGALEAGGESIVVLGAAIDADGHDERPDRVLELFREHGRDRLLSICENGPWIDSQGYHFAKRNRLIAALSDAVVVIQGGLKSGALITARNAFEIEVPVFAVAGPPDNPYTLGPNSLIAEGRATILCNEADVFGGEQKAFDFSPKSSAYNGPYSFVVDALNENEGEADFETLMKKLNLSSQDLLRALSELELEGAIVRRGPLYVLA